jgi:Chromo (CHRromatin Organisation MOdifier) domain
MKELCRSIGIEQNPSTAYHPQTDGQTERVNQELEIYLRMYTNYAQNDWADRLRAAEFAYNNRVHSSTGFSPFQLTTGRHPSRDFQPTEIQDTLTNAAGYATRIFRWHDEARTNLQHANEAMKRSADRKRREAVAYRPGDKVWLEGKFIPTTRPSKKLEDLRYGPFTIIEKVGPAAYRLKLPPSWRIHPVFHEILLTPVYGNHDNEQPPPDIIDGEEEWEIEAIMDHQRRRGRTEYLIHWKGYPREERTWVTEKDLRNAEQLLAEYKGKMGEKIGARRGRRA